jgi:hypothetical protein
MKRSRPAMAKSSAGEHGSLARSTSRVEAILRVTLVAAGLAALVFGAFNLLDQSLVDLLTAAIWFTVPAVLSDLVLLPAIAAVGWLLTKKLSPWIRLPVQVALAMIGSLTALALPFLGKLGLRPDNPSLLNRNYPVGYGIYVTIILVAAALWAARRRVTVGSTRGDT